MKINKTLSLIAVIYLLINLLFYLHASTLNGGSSMGYIFIFPAFWVVTLITVIILSFINRKLWFRKPLLLSTLIAIFFSTPFAISLIAIAARPSTYRVASGGNGADNKTFEEWSYYSNNKPAVTKYWKGYKKDSTWVFFSKKGDAIKTEFYRNDSLINTKVYKER